MRVFVGAAGLGLAVWLLLLFLAWRHRQARGLNIAMLALGLTLSLFGGLSPIARLVLAFREVTAIAPERKATELSNRIEQAMNLVPVAALATLVGAAAVVVFLRRPTGAGPSSSEPTSRET